MSKLYRQLTMDFGEPITSKIMREHSQRPGKRDENGRPIYFTEQAHKDQCDVNKIIRKYDRDGVVIHISRIEAQFGDLTDTDFKQASDLIIAARNDFSKLPSNIRKRFKNDPAELLKFMDNPANRDEAIKLGIIRPSWTPETDGLGEHVPLGGNINRDNANDGNAPKPTDGGDKK